MFTNPTVADFKAYFYRDFTYSTDPLAGVTDADITRALSESAVSINPDLFSTQDPYTTAFLLLSAHNLVINLKDVGAGCSGQAQWLTQSKGAGSVSESFAIPQDILSNPYFAWLSKTAYGNKYLMMVFPLLSGQMFIVEGATQS
jgi:hypothetical protein